MRCASAEATSLRVSTAHAVPALVVAVTSFARSPNLLSTPVTNVVARLDVTAPSSASSPSSYFARVDVARAAGDGQRVLRETARARAEPSPRRRRRAAGVGERRHRRRGPRRAGARPAARPPERRVTSENESASRRRIRRFFVGAQDGRERCRRRTPRRVPASPRERLRVFFVFLFFAATRKRGRGRAHGRGVERMPAFVLEAERKRVTESLCRFLFFSSFLRRATGEASALFPGAVVAPSAAEPVRRRAVRADDEERVRREPRPRRHRAPAASATTETSVAGGTPISPRPSAPVRGAAFRRVFLPVRFEGSENTRIAPSGSWPSDRRCVPLGENAKTLTRRRTTRASP